MKKSNIIIISFLAIFIASIIWLFVWMKNHSSEQEDLKGSFSSEQKMQSSNVLCVTGGNLYCFVEQSDTANKIFLSSSEEKLKIEDVVAQRGDTLFIFGEKIPKNVNRIINCFVTVSTNNKIKSIIVNQELNRFEVDYQAIDTVSFNVFASNGNKINFNNRGCGNVNINNLNVRATNGSNVFFYSLNCTNLTALATENSQIRIFGKVENSETKTSENSTVSFSND